LPGVAILKEEAFRYCGGVQHLTRIRFQKSAIKGR
jgi:hypothetical protein